MNVAVRYIEPSHIQHLQPRSGTVKEVVEAAEREIAKKIESTFGVGVEIDSSATDIHIDGHFKNHHDPKFAAQPWARITESSFVIDAYPTAGGDGSTSNPLLDSIEKRNDKRQEKLPATGEVQKKSVGEDRPTRDPSIDSTDKINAQRLQKLLPVDIPVVPSDTAQLIILGGALQAAQIQINNLIDENIALKGTVQELTAEMKSLRTETQSLKNAVNIIKDALKGDKKADVNALSAPLESLRVSVDAKPR